jgi:hypothetical protein
MKTNASRIRALIRSVLVLVTAFGLDLSADQVAAVQLFAEAVLQLTFKDA